MKTRLLKELRKEAYRNINVIGGWDGYFVTRIYSIEYKDTKIVSGFCWVVEMYGDFIQNSILDYIHNNYKRYSNIKKERKTNESKDKNNRRNSRCTFCNVK